MRTTTTHARQLTRGLAAMAAAGTLVLAGCSSDSGDDASDDATSESAEPSPSESESSEAGDDESESADADGEASVEYDLPEGWEDVTEEVAEQAGASAGGDVISASRQPAAQGDTFADNVNIISIGAAPTDDLDEIESQSLQQLEAGGLTETETLDRADIDGEEAVRQTGVADQQGVQYRVDQFITVRDGNTFVITFSHSLDTSEADREADIATVTDSLTFG